MVQEIQKRRIRCGEGGLMTVQEQKQTTDYIPDISTLLRVGHFYFALTRERKEMSPQNDNVLFLQSKNVLFHQCYTASFWKEAGWQGRTLSWCAKRS